jgi:phenylalanyl-tRNA synthetase alpha chain
MPSQLEKGALERALDIRDLTDPAQGLHALQTLIAEITTALARIWTCAVRIERGNPVVSIADNYDTLGYATDAVTRAARYTRYVDEGHCERTRAR